MNRPQLSHQRIWLLGVALFAIMGVIVVKLFYIQVIQHDMYVLQASKEQVKRSIIPATRGEIYALDGDTPVKLVLNATVYTVFADPSEVENPDEVVDAVKQIAGGTAEKKLRQKVTANNRYQVLARNVTQRQATLLKEKNLRGVGFQQTTQRVYPEGDLAAQTLGFVNAEGYGQYGVEGYLNDKLNGKDGVLQSVTDVRNIPLTIGDNNIRIPAVNGKNVVLTVDRNIQAYTEKTLASRMKQFGATNGSVVVMDPQNGQVLAMANLPTYEPEKFGNAKDASVYNNAVVSAPYEPGSVIKTFTIATGIDKGAITPDSTYVNTDSIKVYDRVIYNASKGQTGTITMQHALNWSLNTGMVTVAQRLGDGQSITYGARKTMYAYFHDKFKMGEPTGIEVAGEASGSIISPDSPQGNAVRYSNMSFGQGMNPTMIQVAAGFSSIVNGGKYYRPTVIAGEVSPEGEYIKTENASPSHRTITASTSRQAKKMIHDARAEFYGASDKKGYDIGGKTGTSQTLINGSYENAQTIGTYLGYGGDSTPRYVIMVQVSAPGKNFAGNTHAMPIFNDISNWLIDYKKLQPSRS